MSSSDNQVIYVINDHVAEDAAPLGDGHCTLDDGGTVICQFGRMQAALAATAGDPALRLVRHEDLSRAEQRRVERALLS
jgi:hypothetical protein